MPPITRTALSLALIRPLGLVGVALGTLVSSIAVDFVWIVGAACKAYGLNYGDYVRRAMVPALVPGLLQLALMTVMKISWPPGGLAAVVGLVIPGMVFSLTVRSVVGWKKRRDRSVPFYI